MDNQIITGGNIYPDSQSAPVEAIAIGNGTVMATGSLDVVREALPSTSPIVDLGGRTVIPGLVESHVHPIFYGLTQGWVDCRSPKNTDIADVLSGLRNRLATLAPGAWLRGWGYDDTLLAENRHPTRDDLDRVSTDVPIAISHISGHFLVANSKALELAGISETSHDPEEGRFIRETSGRLTGLMWEIGAVNRILDCVPRPSATELREAARFAVRSAARRGMTTIHDLGIGLMAGLAELDTWEWMAQDSEFPVRVEGYIRGDLIDEFVNRHPEGFPFSTGLFSVHGAKYWSDGSIQGLSAALTQPYSCREDSCGELLFSHEDLVRLISKVDSLGGQCAVHANGDRAIRTVIDAFGEVRRNGGRQDARHRIEHLQMASTQDIIDLVKVGGGASIFANHVFYWGDRHRDIFLGTERANRLEPLAEAVREGLRFGLHSDCPITPMDPLKTLWTAVSRRTSEGHLLGPSQKLSAAEALRSLTVDSAWLVHQENARGTLAPGMLADLAVVDTDLLNASEDELSDVEVLGTMVGGRWVHGDYQSQTGPAAEQRPAIV